MSRKLSTVERYINHYNEYKRKLYYQECMDAYYKLHPEDKGFITQEEEFEMFKEAAKRLTEEACRSPETARESLVRSGIYNKDGTLHDNYK